MKSHKFLSVPALLLSAGILFASCKKDAVPAASDCRIITVTPNSGNAINLTYYSDGKVETVNNGNTTTVYTYSGNAIISNSTSNGSFGSKRTITLNANGFATNVKTETSTNGSTWYNNAYEYNGTEVIKDTYTTSQNGVPQVTTVTWSNGNLISTSNSGTVTTVEYYTDKPSQAGDYLDVNQLTNGYYIYRTKNLIKSLLSNGQITSFDYIFEGGKITAMKMVNGNSVLNYTYQRQCN